MKNRIIKGDTLSVLKEMSSDSIDCIITSPPYWSLRSYLAKDHPDKPKEIGSEPTFREYLEKLMIVFSECKRVLKPAGSMWLNMGDSYGGSSCGYGQKNDSSGFQNVLKQGYYGTSQNKPLAYGFMEKSLIGQPWRLAIQLQDEQDWILRQDIIWAKQVYYKKENLTRGSAMPSSVKDRFNTTHEHLFHFVKQKRYCFDLSAVRIPVQTLENRPSGIDREKDYQEAKRNQFAFNYRVRDSVKKSEQCPQNYGLRKTKWEKEKGVGQTISSYEGRKRAMKKLQAAEYRNEQGTIHWGKNGEPNPTKSPRWLPAAGKNLPNVWQIGTEPSKELHFAKFPSALCEIPILSSCPKDGIVLDPFCGSGTALEVAQRLGRRWIGIELNKTYIDIAEKKLAQGVML